MFGDTLPQSFYDRDVVSVARELLGKILVRRSRDGICFGRIVETEAYLAVGDSASHSFRGRTKKNATMVFGLFFFLKKGHTKGDSISISFMRNVFSRPSFCILMILLCLANGLNIGIYNMAPDYFQRHNLLDSGAVYNLTIIARILSVLTAIVAGIFADRFGLKRSMVITFVFCGALTSLMGTMTPSSSLLLFCMQSPIAACLMPLIHFAMATIV